MSCLLTIHRSCRLTATPDCCACQDKRPHSSAYRIYVDGVGFVSRGTRWHNYCWFCREFWNNRIERSPPPYRSRPDLSRVPEIPDQTSWLDKWFEFRRGYRLIKRDDGSEVRQAVTGEPWKDVSPGCLPRTLAEVRAGATMSCFEEELVGVRAEEELPEGEDVAPHTSLDDFLDQMLDEADSDDDIGSPALEPPAPESSADAPIHSNLVDLVISEPSLAAQITPRPRRRLRRTEPPEIVDNDRVVDALSVLGSRIDQRHGPNNRPEETLAERVDRLAASLEEARRVKELASRVLQQAEEDFTFLDQQHRQASLGQRRAQNFTRVFGTREDIEREDYESPVDGLFRRAWEYHRRHQDRQRQEQALSANAQEQSQLLSDVQAALLESFSTPSPESATHAVSAEPNVFQYTPSANGQITDAQLNSAIAAEGWTIPSQYPNQHPQLTSFNAAIAAASRAIPPHEPSPPVPRGLDLDDGRPSPKTDEDLVVKLDCKVCYTQIADTAFLPCGHMAMCQWCADQHCPGRESDRTTPREIANCPVCRKRIRRRVKVHCG